MRRVTRIAALFPVALLAAGLSCTEKGSSIVLVDVTTTVSPLETVRVVVAKGGTKVGQTMATWDGSSPQTLKLGVVVSKDVSGAVTIHACGFLDGSGAAAGSGSASVEPGALTQPVAVALANGPLDALCGGSGGTAGTGGGGGTTGVAGAGVIVA